MSPLLLVLTLFAVLLPAAAAGQPLHPPARGFPGFHALFHVPPPPAPTPPVLAPPPQQGSPSPGSLCRAAIAAAERTHAIPAGLLLAIGLVESGRTDPATGQRLPWPWAVNVEGRGALLDTREAALALVRQAEATGIRSIDIGCMQVNRAHHPAAFASLEQGFDPTTNADYAARFLRQLKEGPAAGDWMKAAGFYHSQTPERAEPYRAKVQAALATAPPAARQPPPMPGGSGQSLSNGAEQASLLPATPGSPGRGLDAYRARPVPLALVVAGLRRGVSVGP